jgi:phosphatidylserine decarboxylase
MRLDPAGRPFIGGALLLALASGIALGWVPAVLFVALSGFFAFFFRDPERSPPADSHGGHSVLAPADGRVLVAGPTEPGAAPPGAWQQISIFLSPMDVHVNRIPVSGQVSRVTYTPGKFLPAYRPDAASSNERSELWIDHARHTVVARHIVGILARRVVCRAQGRPGSRRGPVRHHEFGSRMDIFSARRHSSGSSGPNGAGAKR